MLLIRVKDGPTNPMLIRPKYHEIFRPPIEDDATGLLLFLIGSKGR